MMIRTLSSTAVALAIACATQAQPVVDGTLAGDQAAYGAALSVQNTLTQFGDNLNAEPDISQEGSELDAVYATVAHGRLYVMLTGNLETGNVPATGGNWNKMEVFIDSVDGGWNTIPFDGFTNPGSLYGNELPEVDPWSQGGGYDGRGALQAMANELGGLTFDEGFHADYFITFMNGFETEQTSGNFPQAWALTVHYTPLDTLVSFGGTVPDEPTAEWGASGGNTVAGIVGGKLTDKNDPIVNDFDNFWTERDTDNSVVQMEAAINNSNVAGIAGSGGPDFAASPDQIDAAAAVETGIEFSIPLAAIGDPSGEIRITAFINGGLHDFASNQFSGVGVLTGNLAGSFDLINLADIAGDQFVTVAVAPRNEADFDGDGDVDGDDFLAWQAGFPTESNATKMDGDYDNDGDVDGDDFLGWQAQFPFPASGNGSAAVPEPASALLAVLVGAVALCPRRRP